MIVAYVTTVNVYSGRRCVPPATNHPIPRIGRSRGPQTCICCLMDVAAKEQFKCGHCGGVFHHFCYGVPDKLFPNRLNQLEKPVEHTAGDIGRIGDTRRPDFVCPRCNFKTIMRRDPVGDSGTDAWIGLLDVRVTLDEYISDSASYANGCRYTLGKTSRWGRDMGVPTMIAYGKEDLDNMPADHRQLRWYLADLTRQTTWDTAKGHRAAVYNYYERMGVEVDAIPTNNYKFRHFMNGMLQRKGISLNQAQVFTRSTIVAMIRLLRSEYSRAELGGWRRVRLAIVNLTFHAYLQVGARANELFEQKLGMLVDSFCFREMARRKKLRPHLRFRASIQTKEERFATTDLLCCYQAKHTPLKTGLWAEIVVAELTRIGLVDRERLVFSEKDGTAWKMGVFWKDEMVPRLDQLQKEQLGGLEGDDLSRYGSNSFRRTWDTLTASRPDPVSEDLRERQARWRMKSRARKPGLMVRLYCDPRPSELLLATYWL